MQPDINIGEVPQPPEGMNMNEAPDLPQGMMESEFKGKQPGEGRPDKMQNQGQGNKGEPINKDGSLNNSSKIKISVTSIATMAIAVLGVSQFKRRLV